jgi:hypothetical protein
MGIWDGESSIVSEQWRGQRGQGEARGYLPGWLIVTLRPNRGRAFNIPHTRTDGHIESTAANTPGATLNQGNNHPLTWYGVL